MHSRDDWYEIRHAIFRFVTIVLFMALMVGALALDVMVFHNGVAENGATELMQSSILALNVLMFAHLAYLYPQSRGCFVLVMGFFGTMLIRELDGLFDHIRHGFWKYPAWALTLGCIGYARFIVAGTVLSPLATLVRARQFIAISYGLVIVLLFSRIFGNGHLWHAILGEHFVRVAENVAEEGIELLGYGVLFSGCVSYYLQLCSHGKASACAREQLAASDCAS
ncbi:hypothetical protein L9G15_08905 [Shewanella sp. A3A]|nr:hypothetical protein [Shewanella ferrihydritica]